MRARARWLDRLRSLVSREQRVSAVGQPNVGATRHGEDAPRAGPQLADALQAALEAARKASRAALRLEMRVEALGTRFDELGARFDELGAKLDALAESEKRRDDDFWQPLMDALDALDGAREAMERGHFDGTAEGLTRIAARLEALLGRAGYTRHARCGVPVEGRLFRVVGTLPATEGLGSEGLGSEGLGSEGLGSEGPAAQMPGVGAGAGQVARIVRAAVTRAGTLVRTGEVIATQDSAFQGESQ